MKQSAVTNVLNRILECTNNYSLGFTRYVYLPCRVKQAMDLAVYLETKSTDTHKAKIDFLGNLTQSEFETWLRAQ